jgi:acetyl-CoA acetyltransferase
VDVLELHKRASRSAEDLRRRPVGRVRLGGALAGLRATEVETIVASALLDRSSVPCVAVEGVVAGMVLQDTTESNPRASWASGSACPS